MSSFFFFFFAIAYTFQNSLSTAFPQAKPKYIFCYYKHSNKIFVKSKLQLCCVVSNYNIKSCIHNVFATIHELLYLSQCFGTILSKVMIITSHYLVQNIPALACLAEILDPVTVLAVTNKVGYYGLLQTFVFPRILCFDTPTLSLVLQLVKCGDWRP